MGTVCQENINIQKKQMSVGGQKKERNKGFVDSVYKIWLNGITEIVVLT